MSTIEIASNFVNFSLRIVVAKIELVTKVKAEDDESVIISA